MYYKPMSDLPYISSEQVDGLIIHTELIIYTKIKRPIPIQELRAEEGGWAYNTSWAYNMYYTVFIGALITILFSFLLFP